MVIVSDRVFVAARRRGDVDASVTRLSTAARAFTAAPEKLVAAMDCARFGDLLQSPVRRARRSMRSRTPARCRSSRSTSRRGDDRSADSARYRAPSARYRVRAGEHDLRRLRRAHGCVADAQRVPACHGLPPRPTATIARPRRTEPPQEHTRNCPAPLATSRHRTTPYTGRPSKNVAARSSPQLQKSGTVGRPSERSSSAIWPAPTST